MQKIQVEVKRLPSGEGLPLPSYQTAGAAGMDLVAAERTVIAPGETGIARTGMILVVPDGYELQIRSRGGLASKGIFVTNGPGTVDSDYRGETMVLLTNLSSSYFEIERGDRVAQAVFAPVTIAELVEVDEVSETARGEGRFSSTGR